MLIKPAADIPSSEITDKKVYLNRREFIRAAGGTALVTATGALAAETLLQAQVPAPHGRKLVTPEEPAQHDREAEHLGAHHHLQQLLRVRARGRRRPVEAGQGVQARRAVDGHRRRRVRQAGQDESRRHPQGRDARGSHLPPPLRRGVVDGDSLGRVPARQLHQAGRADLESEIRRVHHACTTRGDCPASSSRCWTGPTSKGCGWTKRCIR